MFLNHIKIVFIANRQGVTIKDTIIIQYGIIQHGIIQYTKIYFIEINRLLYNYPILVRFRNFKIQKLFKIIILSSTKT